MKAEYGKEVDVLVITLSDARIEESDEEKPGIVFDYDSAGIVVGIEILNASNKVQNLNEITYKIAV